MSSFTIRGRLVDVHKQRIYPAEITVHDKKIISINELDDDGQSAGNYIMPGFIDSHVHIESSMLVPSEFARLGKAQTGEKHGKNITAKKRFA